MHGAFGSDAGDGFVELVEGLAEVGGDGFELGVVEDFACGLCDGFDFLECVAGFGDGFGGFVGSGGEFC